MSFVEPDPTNHLVDRLQQLMRSHQFDQAEPICDTLLHLDPGHFEAHSCLGHIHFQHNRFDQAIISFTRALESRQSSDIYSNLGLTLGKLSLFDEALVCFSTAIALDPGNATAFYNQGNVMQHLNRLEAALQSYDAAIAINPSYAQALGNRGHVLRNMRRMVEAGASYDQAILLAPDHPVILNNRGVIMMELNRPADALENYNQALAVYPNYTEALYNKGNALLALDMTEMAQESLDQAVASDPDNADAHLNRALFLLLTGNFEEGWHEYEWRWRQRSCKILHHFSQPKWTGHESLSNKTILLYAEQGMGDTLQFIRYINMVKALGAHIILEVQAPLKSLLQNLSQVDQLISQGEAIPAFDYHCPLMSLPCAFNTTLSTIPLCDAAIEVSSEQIAAWASRLNHLSMPRIGLVWSGNPDHQNDHNRSIPLQFLMQHLAPEFNYISVQQELREQDRPALGTANNLLPLGEQLQNFADTAALIATLDLVISVDTSVAHLAGVMGKPVWILLPYSPDWRWMKKTGNSLWYPSARLFRQSGIADWGDTIKHLNQALREAWAAR